MKGQAALEFPFRGNDGFENGNRRMVGEIIHIRTGVVAEGAGFRLFDKPGPRFGIESPAVFVFQHLRGAQIVASVSASEMDETLGIMFCNCISVVNPFSGSTLTARFSSSLRAKKAAARPRIKSFSAARVSV